MTDIIKSRRNFMCRVLGFTPGLLFASPKKLMAFGTETRDLLGQLELEILRSSRPKRDPSIICRSSEDGTTLYRKSGRRQIPVCGINPTGFIIWQACDGMRNLSDISRLVIERYRITEYQARLDTFAFLALLKKTGAVTL